MKIKKTKKILMLCSSLLCASTMLSSVGISSFAASAVEKTVKSQFLTDYDTYEEMQAAANELNAEIAGEGAVLLKNNNNALPLKSNETKVSLFGSASYGSGTYSIESSLAEVGISVNAKLKALYGNSNFADPATSLASAEESYTLAGDIAILTFSRSSGEGSDMSVATSERDANGNAKHNLELTNAEEALVKYVCELKESGVIKKVIVLLQSATAHEVGDLAMNDNIDSIMWIGITGSQGGSASFSSGIMFLGKILTGEINPSGRLVDEYHADFTLDPTYYNFGSNSQNKYTVGEGEEAVTYTGNNRVVDENGNNVINSYYASKGTSSSEAYTSLQYEEGIYMGYRYYETVYADLEKAQEGAGEAWYNAWKQNTVDYTGTGVVYPFGYGLSYSDFDWNIDSVEYNGTTYSNLNEAIDFAELKDGTNREITINLTVRNNGIYEGKTVVQLYQSAPYTGRVERAQVDLVNFVKTDIIPAGGSERVSITINERDLQTFDDQGTVNENKGYVMEEGEYTLYLAADSHDWVNAVNGDNSFVMSLADDAIFSTDKDTGAAVTAVFSQNDKFNTTGYYAEGEEKAQNMLAMNAAGKAMTRAGGLPDTQEELITYAAVSAGAEMNMFKGNLATLVDAYGTYNYDPTDAAQKDAWLGEAAPAGETEPWYVTADEIPASWTQAVDTSAEPTLKLQDMMGIDYPMYYSPEDYDANDEGQQLWDEFLNQFTLDELKKVVNVTTPRGTGLNEQERLGIPYAYSADGATALGSHVSGRSGITWYSATTVAATWNVDLAYKQGVMTGNSALFIDTNTWWGPGANIHRSPFSGRNNEYYSQDGVQGGLIGAAVIKGVTSKGVVTMIKHYALNDQETNRNTQRGVCTWVSEQAIRDIYSKSFEYMIKDGEANGLMSGFNRYGAISCAGNYALNNQLTRGEWGFDGDIITDAYQDCRVPGTVALASGCNQPLPADGQGACNFGGSSSSAYGDIDGTWDPTLRGGKGNVVYNEANDNKYKADSVYSYAGSYVPVDETVEVSSSYFALRACVQQTLYTYANSNAMLNGFVASDYAGAKLDAANAGLSYTATLGAGEGVEAEVASGELPAGLSISSDRSGNLVLSGTPTTAGEYSFSLSLVKDVWVTATSGTYTVSVASSQVFDGELTADTSAPYYAEISVVDAFKAVANDDEGALTEGTTFTYTVVEGELPEGLAIESSDGIGSIYGTPTETGTFTFSVRARIGVPSTSTDKKGNTSTRYTNYDAITSYTLTVTGEQVDVPVEPEADFQVRINEDGMIQITNDAGATWVDVINKSELKGDTGAAGEDGVTPTVEINEDGYWVVNGEVTNVKAVGVDGEDGAPGKDGADGAGALDGVMETLGCSASMTSSFAIFAVVAVGGAIVALRKKDREI